MPKNEVWIYYNRVVIYQNDYDVWQFRMWLADEDKYIRQSLRSKDKEKVLLMLKRFMMTSSIWSVGVKSITQ